MHNPYRRIDLSAGTWLAVNRKHIECPNVLGLDQVAIVIAMPRHINMANCLLLRLVNCFVRTSGSNQDDPLFYQPLSSISS